MLTPDEVLQQRFDEVNVRPGYDPDEVDDFLDTAAQALRERLGPGDEPLLPSDRAASVGFTQTRFRRGYDPAQVDGFLDRLVDALRVHEAQALGGPAAS